MPLQRRLGETYVLQDAATSSNQHKHERVSHLTEPTAHHTSRGATPHAQEMPSVLSTFSN